MADTWAKAMGIVPSIGSYLVDFLLKNRNSWFHLERLSGFGFHSLRPSIVITRERGEYSDDCRQMPRKSKRLLFAGADRSQRPTRLDRFSAMLDPARGPSRRSSAAFGKCAASHHCGISRALVQSRCSPCIRCFPPKMITSYKREGADL